MRKKSIISIIVALTLTISCLTAVCATASVTTTTADRNAIATNWTFYSQGVYENNCLAYSLGNTTDWIWPWSYSNPTLAQTKTYMNSRGYTGYDTSFIGAVQTCQIMAYGTSSSINHFSKIISDSSGSFTNGTCRAKWGHAEIFTHSNLNPYTNLVYGSSICKFRK